MDSINSAIHSAKDFLMVGLGYVAIAAFIILLIFSLYFSLRYVIRAIYNIVRRLYYGGMVWYKIVPESNSIAETSRSVALMQNAVRIMPMEMGGSWNFVYWIRPRMSVAIKIGDESPELYVGSGKRFVDENAIKSWASRSGGSCIKVDDIEFDRFNPAVATMSSYSSTNFENSPQNSTVGQVISNVQRLIESGVKGTFILSYEPMRDSERSLLRDHISARLVKESGDNNAFSNVNRHVGYYLDSRPARATFTAFSDEGGTKDSKTILTTVIDNVTHLGAIIRTRTFYENNRWGSIWALVFAGLSVALSKFFMGTPQLVISGVALVIAVISATTPFLTNTAISYSCKDGMTPLPPFWRWSPRRKFSQFRDNSSNMDIDTGSLKRPYTAEPSEKTILPLYPTSLMQIASFPENIGQFSNLNSSVIPPVGVSKSYNSLVSDFVDTSDAIFWGISAGNHAPVYRTLKDIGYGIAVGGASGSGKTNLLHMDFVGMSQLSRKTTGQTGDYTINPIWVETKPEDIDKIISSVEQFKPKVVSVHDNNSPRRLCLEGPRATDNVVGIEEIQKNANTLADTVKAAFGDSMMERGHSIFRSSLLLSLILNKEDIKELNLQQYVANVDRPNVMEIMLAIHGGIPSYNALEQLKSFANNKESLLQSDHRKAERDQYSENELKRITVTKVSVDGLIKMHERRDDPFTSVNNIVKALIQSPMWDTTTPEGVPRKELGIKKLLTYGGPVIADFCVYDSRISAESANKFTMIFNHILWSYASIIKSGAGSRNDFTPIYVDELANITGFASEKDNNRCKDTFSHVLDRGRSAGFSYNCGYQSLAKLPSEVRVSVLEYRSNVFMSFNSGEEALLNMGKLSSKTIFTEDNLVNFPRGIGIASLTINDKKIKPFTLCTPRSHDWADIVKRGDDLKKSVDAIYDPLKEEVVREGKKKIDNDFHNSRKRREHHEDETYSAAGLSHDDYDDDDNNFPL